MKTFLSDFLKNPRSGEVAEEAVAFLLQGESRRMAGANDACHGSRRLASAFL